TVSVPAASMSAAPMMAAPVRSIRKPGNRPIARTRYVAAKIRIGASTRQGGHSAYPTIIELMRGFRIALVLLLSVCCFAQKREAEFGKLADRFFDEYLFKFDPASGTQAGFHQYDALLPSGSRAEINEQVAVLKKLEGEVDAFGAQGLSSSVAADRELVLSNI